MAFLIGSASTTRFTTTYAINSGASGTGLYLVGNPTDTSAVATGTAQTLWLYISSWGTQANIKCCIYDETNAGALLETVIISSAVGTGLVAIPLAGTSTITSGNNYRLGVYTEDVDDITFYTDDDALTLRRFSSSGSYTTPADPSNQSGGFDSNNEFYFAIDDVSVPSISITTDGVYQPGVAETHTPSGFGGSLNQGSLIQGTRAISLGSVTEAASTPPEIANGGNAMLYGDCDYQVGDGTDTATDSGVFAAGPGTDYVELAGTLNTGTDSVLQGWSAEVGGQITKDPALVIDTDGTVLTAPAGTYTCYYVDPTDAQPTWEEFSVLIGASGEVEVPVSDKRKKRKKRIIRNFYYYREEWEKAGNK